VRPHPLINQSLAPQVFTTDAKLGRRRYVPQAGVNRERIITTFWDKIHRRAADKPYPLQIILHEILLRRCPDAPRSPVDFDFEGYGYAARDIFVVTSMVQWLGTNVGTQFYEDRTLRACPLPDDEGFWMDFEERWGWNTIRSVLHECTSTCVPSSSSAEFGDGHDYAEVVSERDLAVVEAFFVWLGMPHGRAFTLSYEAQCRQAAKSAGYSSAH
jgi:hypothetical protein